MAERIQNPDTRELVFSGGIIRRINPVREHILAHYPNIQYIQAENETFLGLFNYAVKFVTH